MKLADVNGTSLVKTTAVSTAVIVLIFMQVTILRAVGDIFSSLVIFGLGYAACALRKSKTN